MLSLPASIRVYLASAPVDFRNAHVAVVRDHFGDDPFDGSVFVFLNRRRDRVKLLLWDPNGFWLLYKRLERGTFRSLRAAGEKRAEVSRAELSMLLEGIDLEGGKIRKHFVEGVRIQTRSDAVVSERARAT